MLQPTDAPVVPSVVLLIVVDVELVVVELPAVETAVVIVLVPVVVVVAFREEVGTSKEQALPAVNTQSRNRQTSGLIA